MLWQLSSIFQRLWQQQAQAQEQDSEEIKRNHLVLLDEAPENFQITAAVDQIAKIAMDNALIANAQDVRNDGNNDCH